MAKLIARADEARDRKEFRKAATQYRKALHHQAENAPIHVQCGNMFKELREFTSAERHYLEAQRLRPDDADLAMQFGHLFKMEGRTNDARTAYERALSLRPEWEEPREELLHLDGNDHAADEKIPESALIAGPNADTDRFRAVLMSRADSCRDEKQYRNAATLYQEALRLQPDDAGLQVMCGHMFKEAGEFGSAEDHYLQASLLTPNDADLAMQFGHLYKITGKIKQAVAAYEQVALLRPGWWEPAAELEHLRKIGWIGVSNRTTAADLDALEALALPRAVPQFDAEVEAIRASSQYERLVPEIAPRRPHQLWHEHGDSLHIRKFGRRNRSASGIMQIFDGVEAMRGFCYSSVPIVQVQILLNNQLIHAGPVRGGYQLHFEKNSDLRKYVFNVWLDFSPFQWGKHQIEVRVIDTNWGTRSHIEHIVIAPPLSETDHPNSSAIISLSEHDPRSIDDQINTRASVVRPAKRDLFPPINNVLILRTDQLGDMVTSIPAMRRLRELFPQGRLVGLLTSGNADFAKSLGLFDEVIVIDFPDDRLERRRIMSLEKQEELRQQLKSYHFDLALDLAEASTSRPLLLLSGAPFLYGFHDGEWPWLSAGFEGNSRDPKNERETFPQSTRVLSFIERLGAMLGSRAEVIRRPDLTRSDLSVFGLSETDRYVVMHAGARIEAARWPHYLELASLFIERTDLKVVLITDDDLVRATLPVDLTSSARFQLLDKRLNFDHFDALVSFCFALAGNDSGPKHLASLRGTHVVSIHPGRVNWQEWGQEMAGSIITRKVPCAGCQLVYDNEECGRDYVCITEVTPEEVFTEMMKAEQA